MQRTRLLRQNSDMESIWHVKLQRQAATFGGGGGGHLFQIFAKVTALIIHLAVTPFRSPCLLITKRLRQDSDREI